MFAVHAMWWLPVRWGRALGWMPSSCRLQEMSNQRTWNITQSSDHKSRCGFCLPTENCHWKSTAWCTEAAGLLWSCWVILLLQWKERSGVCRAGSASAFLTIPGSRICSPGLSISFWFSIPPPSSHLMVETEPFLSCWIPKSSFLLSFCGGKKGFQERKQKEPSAGTETNLAVWLQGLEEWRRGHCTELCSWRSKVSPSVWAGFACANYSPALYFAYSHMVLLTKHRAAPLRV